MKDDIPSEIFFDFPLIKFSGKSAVKELAVTVHVYPDKLNRLHEFFLKIIQIQLEKENTKYAKQKR